MHKMAPTISPWKQGNTRDQLAGELQYILLGNTVENQLNTDTGWDGIFKKDECYSEWWCFSFWSVCSLLGINQNVELNLKKWYRWLYKQTLMSQSNFLDLNYSTSLLQKQKTWSEFIAPYHLEGLHSLFFME